MAKHRTARAPVGWRLGVPILALCLGLPGCAQFFSPEAPGPEAAARQPAKVFAFKKASPRAPKPSREVAVERASAPARSANAVACGAKTSCDEIATCAEAYRLLNVCGAGQLAAGDQGVPCPALCGDTIESMTTRLKAQRAAFANQTGSRP